MLLIKLVTADQAVDKYVVSVNGLSLGATSPDRLLYLVLHKWRVMGSCDVDFLSKRMRPGETVVDVGANIGIYALLFSRLVGSAGSVLSLEPHPLLSHQLIRNVERNGAANVQVKELAAGAEKSRLLLDSNPLNSGDNRLVRGPAGTPRDRGTVEVVPLDLLVSGTRVDWVKIDVQGWEPAVISGMSEILKRNPQIQLYFEFSPSALLEAGFSPQEYLEKLLSLGFVITDPRVGHLSRREVAKLHRRRGYLNLHAKRQF